jgi:hypothetical protein
MKDAGIPAGRTSVKYPKNGSCILSLTIIFAVGLNVPNDFSFFDAAPFHSSRDTGSIEEFADSRLPQPALLRASESMRNTMRQNKTNNPGFNQTHTVSARYDTDTMTMIKENEQNDIKNGIRFKLRI